MDFRIWQQQQSSTLSNRLAEINTRLEGLRVRHDRNGHRYYYIPGQRLAYAEVKALVKERLEIQSRLDNGGAK